MTSKYEGKYQIRAYGPFRAREVTVRWSPVGKGGYRVFNDTGEQIAFLARNQIQHWLRRYGLGLKPTRVEG